MNARLYIAVPLIATFLFPAASVATWEERSVQPVGVEASDPVLFDVLSAEWALTVNQEKDALASYMKALREHPDAAIAERTTFLALGNRAATDAYTAAKIWSKLSPENGQAQEILLHLSFIEGDIENQSPAFLKLLASNHSETEAVLFDLYQGLDKADRIKLHQLTEDNMTKAKRPEKLMLALAHYAFIDHDIKKALKFCEAALVKMPHDKSGILFKAELLRLASGEKASLHYLESVSAKSNDPEILMYTVDLLLKGHQNQRAIPILNRLTHTDKRSSAFLYLAQLSLDRKDNNQAITYLEEVKKDPGFADAAFYFIARIKEEMHEYDKAVFYYSQVSKGEYEITAHIFASNILTKQKKYEEAIQLLTDTQPKDVDEMKTLSLHKADIVFQSGNPQGALDILEAASVELPNDIDLQYAEAIAAEQLHKFDLMESRLRSVIAQDPKHIDALNALGYNFANRKIHLDEALSLLKQAYDLDPINPLVLDSLAWVHYRLGQLKEAKLYGEKALAISGDPEIASHLGQILWEKGEYTQARHTIHTALQKHPTHPNLQNLAKKFEHVPSATAAPVVQVSH